MRAFEPKQLAYEKDSIAILDRWVDCKNLVFLDSAAQVDNGYYCDILAADPTHVIRSRDGKTRVSDAQGEQQTFAGDPLDVVRRYIPQIDGARGECFNGGLMGYFSYDFGRRIESLRNIAEDSEQLPELVLGVYHWAVYVDHRQQETYLLGYAGDGFDDADFEQIYQMLQTPAPQVVPQGLQCNSALQINMNADTYRQRFDQIKQYIKNGDCYQVNLAQKFSIEAQCNPRDAYKSLRVMNPAPFSAYLEYDDFQILSVSPERFLQVKGGRVETKPIKGTRPRGINSDDDNRQKENLLASQKDHAENLMIVDLLRNDLGKVCKLGTVAVSKLFAVESFANVHHLVSTVVGDLAEDKSVLDLLRACFPGGSITGAPKLRAMEIIEELEPHRRGVYCGAIGYIGGHKIMDLNIAIRTALYKDKKFIFYGGGGIVADSVAEEEHQEIFDKVSSIIGLFPTD